MLKRTIKYEDFDGNQREEDFYFNLTKAEVIQYELSMTGGLAAVLERLIQIHDVPELIKHYTNLIDLSYGEKSLDGKHFVKTPELLQAFKATGAYSQLYSELALDPDAAATFINSIIPQHDKDTKQIKLEDIKK